MKLTRAATAVTAAILAGAFVGLPARQAQARRKITVRQALDATGVDPDARGDLRLSIYELKNGMLARLDVKVKRLERRATYQVLLDGVPIGELLTNGGGNGRVRFSTHPRRRDQLLGSDPRGMTVQVQLPEGDMVLEGMTPDDTIDPANVRCCLAQVESELTPPECEDRPPNECVAAGGTVIGHGSCLPNPCEAASPTTPEEQIVCCTPEDDEPECELRSAAKCSQKDGINLGQGTCDPNPCVGVVPPVAATIQCCLADDDEVECEDRTPERCAEQGGTDMGPGTCRPNPCPQVSEPDTIRCCVPDEGTEGAAAQCEDRTAEQCAEAGGTVVDAPSCDPNPCG